MKKILTGLLILITLSTFAQTVKVKHGIDIYGNLRTRLTTQLDSNFIANAITSDTIQGQIFNTNDYYGVGLTAIGMTLGNLDGEPSGGDNYFQILLGDQRPLGGIYGGQIGFINNDNGNRVRTVFDKIVFQTDVITGSDTGFTQVSKNGFLISNSFSTPTATATLDVRGTARYVDGNQSDGYVLTSDADGYATWKAPVFGEMGFGDSLSIIELTQNTYTLVSNANKDLWAVASVDLNGITYSNDSIIIEESGYYKIEYSLSLNGVTNSILEAGIFINGSLGCTCGDVGQLVNNIIIPISFRDVDYFNAGDVIQPAIQNQANNDDVYAVAGKFIITKL